MRNFSGGNNRGGGFRGGRGGRGGGSGFRGRDDDRKSSMHRAMCSECGNSCEVPFRPTGEKPVYCNDCFGSKKAREERGGRENRSPRRDFNDQPRVSFDKPSNDDSKKLLMEVISKLDRLTGLMEKFGQTGSSNKSVETVESEVKVEAKKKAPAKTVKKEPTKKKK